MTEKTRKPRTDVKVLMNVTREILRERTDKDNPLTVTAVLKILKEQYELEPDRDTVAGVLNALLEDRGGLERVCRKEYPREEDDPRREYPGRYYMERGFSAEEVEMLINDAMFSRMRTQGQAKSLIRKLKELAGPYHKKELAYADFLPFSLYTANTLVQRNLAVIQRVIAWNLHKKTREKVISFRFNGYGSDHEIHEVPGGEYQNFVPLKIFEAYGHYYVMGLLDKRKETDEEDRPWNFRLDLMTRVDDSRERDKVTNEAREEIARMASGANALAEYLTQHLYMAYERKGEKVETVYLQVEKIFSENEWGEKVYYKPLASMTILRDTFGENYEVLFENDRYVDIRVQGVLWGITSFVRQYIDRVRVTGPEDVKAKVEASLRKSFEEYFSQGKKS